MKKIIPRGLRVIAATVTAMLGTTGMAFAGVNANTMGPNSPVNVSENSTYDCSVINTNNLKLKNSTYQNASTGDANVSGNTSVGYGDNWGAWSPTVWAAQGHTYAEWASAFQAHMADIQSHWGAVGGATTGDASNTNSTTTNVMISNGGGCHQGMGGMGGVNVGTQGPNSGVGVVLGSSTNNNTYNNNKVYGANMTGQNSMTGDANVSGNTWAGGSGSGSAANSNGTGSSVNVNNQPSGGSNMPGGQGGGSMSTTTNISTAGPNSPVNYTSTNTSNTSVVNVNTITNLTTTHQTSSTGDANVSGNTSAGGASTGDASNYNQTSSNITIHN